MYKNGVYEGLEDAVVTEMKDIVGIHCGILRSPTYLLSDSATSKITRIVTRVHNGEFNFVSGTAPLPTAKHSIYFDVLCGLFASNWNEKGILHFTFSNVLRESGKSPNSRSRLIVAETIKRYLGCSAYWENFMPESIDDTNWSGSLISESSIFDKKGNLMIKRIGTTKTTDDHHWIRFHHKIAEALNPNNDPKTRLFQSEIFKLGLSQPEQIVYRYFYGHWDSKEVWKSLFKDKEGLINIFKWTSPKRKFLPWLTKALDGLKKQNLVDYYKFNEDKSAIGVKCFNIKDLKKTGKIELICEEPHKNKRNGATKLDIIDIEKITPERVLEEYLTRKEKGLMDESKVTAIDGMLSAFKGKTVPEFAINAIKNALT